MKTFGKWFLAVVESVVAITAMCGAASFGFEMGTNAAAKLQARKKAKETPAESPEFTDF